MLTIGGPGLRSAYLFRVIDALGASVLDGRTTTSERFDPDIRDLKPGIYAVQVYGEGRMGIVRFVKQWAIRRYRCQESPPRAGFLVA